MTKPKIQFPQLLYECNIELFLLNNRNCDLISITEFNNLTAQKLPFGVHTTIHLKNVIATSDNTSILLSRNMPY